MDECVKNIESSLYADCLNKTPKERIEDIANVLGGSAELIGKSEKYIRLCIRDIPRKDSGYYPPVILVLEGCEITESSVGLGVLQQYEKALKKCGYIIKN